MSKYCSKFCHFRYSKKLEMYPKKGISLRKTSCNNTSNQFSLHTKMKIHILHYCRVINKHLCSVRMAVWRPHLLATGNLAVTFRCAISQRLDVNPNLFIIKRTSLLNAIHSQHDHRQQSYYEEFSIRVAAKSQTKTNVVCLLLSFIRASCCLLSIVFLAQTKH